MTFGTNVMPKRFGADKPKPKGPEAVQTLKDGKWQPKGKK